MTHTIFRIWYDPIIIRILPLIKNINFRISSSIIRLEKDMAALESIRRTPKIITQNQTLLSVLSRLILNACFGVTSILPPSDDSPFQLSFEK